MSSSLRCIPEFAFLHPCGLWIEASARAPSAEPAPVQMELLYVADGDICPPCAATG